jgi:PhnB protein
MDINPYLFFDGNCEAAFRFYEQSLGGTIEFMLKHGESPMAEQTRPEWRDLVMQARMTIGGQVLMGSDACDRYSKPQGFCVSLKVEDRDDAQRKFDALAQGGTTTMPFEKTFWAEGFGMLVDRFGVPWMVACERK